MKKKIRVEFGDYFFIKKIHFIIFSTKFTFSRVSIFEAPYLINNYSKLPIIRNGILEIKGRNFYIVFEVFFYEPSRDKVQGEIYVSVDLYRLVIFILSTTFTFEAETYVLQSDFIPESWPISCRYPFLDQSDHR